jgi:hypothetical protein
MKFILGYILLSLFASSCQSYSSQKLTKEDTTRIKSLGLLGKDEKIIMYTANYYKDVTGSFVTTKRIAHYWIDERDSLRNSIGSAFFLEIETIDTIYNTVSLTQASFMVIRKKDKSSFKVYVSGTKEKVTSFFLQSINSWKAGKTKKP